MTHRREIAFLICVGLLLAVGANAMVRGGDSGPAAAPRTKALVVVDDDTIPALSTTAAAKASLASEFAERPARRRLDEVLVGVDDRASDPKVVRALQRELAALGYEPGRADGEAGVLTRAAIMAYEHDQQLPLTGIPSEALLRQVLGGFFLGAGEAEQASEGAVARRITLFVEERLEGLDFQVGTVDGNADKGTAMAIRRFEASAGLKSTGRISAPLLVALDGAPGKMSASP